MRRFLVSPLQLNTSGEYDVIVVGTGIAGMYTALNLPHHLKVALISKTTLEETNSYLAQGGIAVTMVPEDYAAHIEDTLVAGSHVNDRDAVRVLVEEGHTHIHRLIEWGVLFDRNEAGELLATREGGHSKRRVLHAKDATGKEVMRALYAQLEGKDHINVLTQTTLVDVLTVNNQITGISVYDCVKGHFTTLKTSTVILATGGIGQLYHHTTNAQISMGDGLAAAYRAGAEVKDLEMIQFHPTAFYQAGLAMRFLISEAVRGEGAIIRNSSGEAFMANRHPLKDLAPRDIVAKEMYVQMKKTQTDFVYLDVTHLGSDYIKHRFPTIYTTCMDAGIDITKEWIPVSPVEHYHMGGIAVDLYGQTSIVGLFAVGEVACSGVHGANRLASNSLLEALVFGGRIAAKLDDFIPKQGTVLRENNEAGNSSLKVVKSMTFDLSSSILENSRTALTEGAFIFRSLDTISRSMHVLEELALEAKKYEASNENDVSSLNALQNAILILRQCHNRIESLGAHQLLKEDFENA